MKTRRGTLIVGLGSLAWMLVWCVTASAQVANSPDYKPTKNDGGWVYQAAQILGALAIVMVIALIAAYMMRAPRFARHEEELKVVRADRVRAGKELPRRSVDVSQAATVIVAPPAIPSSVAAPAPTVTAPAPPASAPAAVPAATASAPAAPVPAPAAEAASAPATPATPAAPPAERPEVALDQETFDKTLEELLAKGTDRRVAEGQARRAAIIAARKKAEG